MMTNTNAILILLYFFEATASLLVLDFSAFAVAVFVVQQDLSPFADAFIVQHLSLPSWANAALVANATAATATSVKRTAFIQFLQGKKLE